MNFFTRYVSGPLGAALIAVGLMVIPVSAPVTVSPEARSAPVVLPQAREQIAAVRAGLQDRSAEIAELAKTSEVSDQVDLTTADLAAAQQGVTDAVADLSTPGIEVFIVPEEETQALLDAGAAALVELETSYEAWTAAVDVARAEREAAEATAAEAAAAEAAAASVAEQAVAAETQAEAAANSSDAAGEPAPVVDNTAPAAADFTVYPGGSGGQDLIDACVGPIWTGGLPMYLAEHWHCGGAAFPLYTGAIVNVAGVGTFQSVGVVIQLDGPNSTYADIPGGYDLYYQTCLNNNPATTGVVGLQRIG